MKLNLTTFFITILFVLNLQAQNSENVTRVLDYSPAPGQHTNRLFPTAAMSNTKEDVVQFAQNTLVNNKGMLGLGSFGGYIIVGFDHSVVNLKGEYDFKILGNAMINGAEPGIVMVCQDLNNNGKPDADEPWYELAGSEYHKAGTIKNYEITYYRPNSEKPKSNIKWTDNQGNSGEITHISFASQATMYPNWIKEDNYSLKGTKLASTVYNDGTFKLPALDWGYADNHPNNENIEKNGFKIDWAVDEKGNSVELSHIDFIKIHTAQLQEAGWLGETSTEISAVIDLHPNEISAGISQNQTSKNKLKIISNKNVLKVLHESQILEISIFNMQGANILQSFNTDYLHIESISHGYYIIRVKDSEQKEYYQTIIIN